ncbi:hypothetical protein ACFFWD_17920 [Bradyrhizobium erythrophlei]|uniref:hypothetical protein n=1 Tax=Bradyrhizobium erythrophlei TaxID=1437360 RepID=UPI0035ED2256
MSGRLQRQPLCGRLFELRNPGGQFGDGTLESRNGGMLIADRGLGGCSAAGYSSF